ncbi:MAG: PDZ domain-containing protein, partial [Elusimicrobiota bacterium]|nr:PDZ domain-containing protein [Elusimicrobiota bacterium]
IIRFDGKRITDETQIRTLLAEKKPGDIVKLTILRGRRRLDIKFETAGGGWWQGQPAAIQNKSVNLLKNAEIETGSAEIVSLGIAAITITPEIAFTYGLPKDARGIIATETEGLALNCGIKDGDIIKKVNNRPTPDLVSFLKAIKKGDPSSGIALSLIRGGIPMEMVIKEKPQLLPRGL